MFNFWFGKNWHGEIEALTAERNKFRNEAVHLENRIEELTASLADMEFKCNIAKSEREKFREDIIDCLAQQRNIKEENAELRELINGVKLILRDK
ncbi:hypothetical protein FACS189454_04340 [Planctomycetales bacterium]|nr:hypothetical protein FACS189454_04340 [Planctomycetales bacterium]